MIGNKWETYLDLLQADYTEGWVPQLPLLLLLPHVLLSAACPRRCCPGWGLLCNG